MLPSYFPAYKPRANRPRGNRLTNSGAWFKAKNMSCIICF